MTGCKFYLGTAKCLFALLWVSEIEHPPYYRHHFIFSLANDTVLNVDDSMLSSAEDRCVLVKDCPWRSVFPEQEDEQVVPPTLKGSHARK